MKARAFLYVTLSNVIGGATYIGAAYSMKGGLTPAGSVFWRTLMGGLLFIPFLFRRKLRAPTRREWLQMAGVGLLGLAAPLLLGTLGVTMTTTTNAALLVAVEPIAIVLLSAVFLGERLSWLKALAIGLGVAGSALIILQGLPGLGARLTPHFKGDMIIFVHSGLWALYTIIGKDALKTVDPFQFSAITTAFCLVPVSAFAVAGGLPLPPAAAMPGLLFLAVGATFLGVVLWNEALQLMPASQLANFIFLQPLVGVALGTLWQKEPFSAWSAAGGGLILAGVYAAVNEKEPS